MIERPSKTESRKVQTTDTGGRSYADLPPSVFEEALAGRFGHGHLLDNMVLFSRLLRAGGLDVTPTDIADWVAASECVALEHRQDFRQATRTTLVHRHEDLDWFEAAFDLFWQARDPRQLQELELGLLVQATRKRTERTAVRALDNQDETADDSKPPLETAAYSKGEALRHKDFAKMSAEELAEMKRLMTELRFDLDTRKARRRVPAKLGSVIDLRRSLKRSLRTEGELLDLARRTKKQKKRPLVLLCDISGSMEPYSRLLLHFIYAICHQKRSASSIGRVESFVFGTRLSRITQELREHDPDRALAKATQLVTDWGGGTRTGEALEEFNRDWSRRVLGQGAVVMIISDGWDRGDIDLLGTEMARLGRSCHRLVWLNPLLGSPGYQPLTRGMQAALPHIDDFLPVHNLHSLEQLGKLLETL